VQFSTSLADLAVKCSERTVIGLGHRSKIPHFCPTSIARKQRKSWLILAVPWLQITCNVPSLITEIKGGKSSMGYTASADPISITPLRLFLGEPPVQPIIVPLVLYRKYSARGWWAAMAEVGCSGL
jgi:hypothetical protein